MLELENVSTSYGQVQMLRGLSMNVRKGELVCLLGPNGAGKSTTFKALSGLLPLDGGAVRMLGEDVALGDHLLQLHTLTQCVLLVVGVQFTRTGGGEHRELGCVLTVFGLVDNGAFHFVSHEVFPFYRIVEVGGISSPTKLEVAGQR